METNVNQQIELQRLRYRQNQMLLSRDFRDQALIQDQLRWWHNRALHKAYGIVLGIGIDLRVDLLKDGIVEVHPGLAYDIVGRELLLAHDCQLPLPSGDGDWTLLARYPGATSPAEVAPDCQPAKPPRLTLKMDLHWESTNQVTPRAGVPLAAFSKRVKVPLPVPRVVRPYARPYIATGITDPNATDWQLWQGLTVVDHPENVNLGIEVMVDTSTAGFTQTPYYFAWLGGGAWGAFTANYILDFLPRVDQETPATFRFCVFAVNIASTLAASPSNSLPDLVALARQRKLHVCWLGIQPPPPWVYPPDMAVTTAQGESLQ